VSTTAWIFLGLGVWIGLLRGVGALCRAAGKPTPRAPRERDEDGPRRCRALVADGPVPDGVDEDAKALRAEFEPLPDGEWDDAAWRRRGND
jgi:hypothetical protein